MPVWFDSVMKTLRADFCWLCLLGVGWSGCSTVPETGRRQINFIPQVEEMQLGLCSFEKMKQEAPMSKDTAANALVQEVGKRIAAVAQVPHARWELAVCEAQEATP